MADKFDEILGKAKELYVKGMLSEAEPLLEALLYERHDDPDVLSMLGLIKMHKADYNSALRIFSAALDKRPDVARLHFQIALALAKLHRVDEAEQFLLSGLEIDPADDIADRVKAAILIERGQFEEAYKILSMLVNEDKVYEWDVWNDLGKVYYEMEQFEHAHESFEHAIGLAKVLGIELPFLYYNLGLSELAQGMRQKAKVSLSKALELDSELAMAWSMLGGLVAEDGDAERGIDYIGRAIDLQPEEPTHWYMMARVYEMIGDKQAAEHYLLEGYKAFIAQMPDYQVPDGAKGH